jgi:DNA polymerase I-like protein with 3'-5' exonuclease and polymerase domains
LIDDVLRTANGVFGYVSNEWLQECIRKFGPLTHHLQLKASIIVDVLEANGIGIATNRSQDKAKKVRDLLKASKERMRQRGYLVDEPGSAKALQSILSELKRKNPDLELKRTESGQSWSTSQEDLAALISADSFFADYRDYRAAEKLLSTYLGKMGRSRLHPRFGYLLETGRTYCGGGFNLQNLPREKTEHDAASTIRGCFVPGDGNVFIDSDFSQIELVVLGHVLEHQLGLDSVLGQLVNSGEDVHRLIAARMLSKKPKEVTKEERNSVKPISFGRPGGMGADGLRRVARNGYGIELTTQQVEERIAAYHRLCPELDAFLTDEVDAGYVIANTLNLTRNRYLRAVGQIPDLEDPMANLPQGWLGGMLLKTLGDEHPITHKGQGRPYSDKEIAFFWDRAQELAPHLDLKIELLAKLRSRTADWQLQKAVANWAGRRPVFTITGRLRANTTYCSSRNNLFQGPAADGAVLALWNVWRARYRLVDFVHDQIVVESPADDEVHDRVTKIECLMKQAMLDVVPGMLIKVETVVSSSLHKADLDSRYLTLKKKVTVR